MDELSEAQASSAATVGDIEDLPGAKVKTVQPTISISKRKRIETVEVNSTVQNWREALGRPPPMGNSEVCSTVIFVWLVG